MEKENMKLVDLTTEITRRYHVQVLVHKDMVDDLESVHRHLPVQPYQLEMIQDNLIDYIDGTPVEIENVSSIDEGGMTNVVLTKGGLVTYSEDKNYGEKSDFENFKSEDLVWGIK